METCYLKKYLYKGERCQKCQGTPTTRCYITLEEFNDDKQFFYEMFIREYELDSGKLEEMLEVMKREEKK